jgi:hypothetical protein
LRGATLGPLALGITRAHARKMLPRFVMTTNQFDNFCLSAGWGIRAAYASTKLLASLPAAQRAQIRGRIVILLTANPFYALHGVRPGMHIATAAKKLGLQTALHIGLNYWYIAPGSASHGVLKVRDGIIQEIGIADKNPTDGRRAQARFLTHLS